MLGPYREVLRTPHTIPMELSGFIGRLPLSMVGLGSVFLIIGNYPGKAYGLGGTVAAVGAIATAIMGPILGRLADRFGQRRVLIPVVILFGAGATLFIIAVKNLAPAWVLCIAALLAGGCIPPVGSMLRARWSYLLEGSRRLPAALAMESVLDELVFIIGPVLVTFLSSTGHATSGMVVAAALAVIGSLTFAAQHRTEPPPGRSESYSGPSAIRTPGLSILCLVGLSMGMTLGTFELVLVAFAKSQHESSLAGVLIAALAVGSMLSGIVWGTINWLAPLNRRLLLILCALAIATLPMLVTTNIWLLLIFVVICGMAVSPTLITSFTLCEELVPRESTNEGFTWIGTTIALGVAVGTSASGIIVDSYNANLAFGVATIAAGISALAVWAAQRLLHPKGRIISTDSSYGYPDLTE
ncbi:putative MFS family arabinose efflux permease [Antricoccus suffuscus]|uniref:Putative MFS family arabinose efflux permease n=1 Tax=Antricoccus suffuscus TaxID=1629062 RepID=A0A2T0ZBM3_9ACTN|nr:MFS transporter [Antricoccus suffuscus]PRZ33558.1 putative MFS family arabinose efflux permease [Antricoccus suffuscus]